MFNAILDANTTKKVTADSDAVKTDTTTVEKINWSFTELWRFAFVGTEYSTKEKHINNGNVLPCCFDYRPNEHSVSLYNVLGEHVTIEKKAEVINELISSLFDLRRWGKVCIENERMKLSLSDPMTQRILERIKLSHNNSEVKTLSSVQYQHWDLKYLSNDGREITASNDDQVSAFDIKNYFVEISYFFVDSK